MVNGGSILIQKGPPMNSRSLESPALPFATDLDLVPEKIGLLRTGKEQMRKGGIWTYSYF